jgi:hypothetical protein
MLGVFVTACGKATKLERMKSNIDFVNSQDARIYLYNIELDVLTQNVKNTTTIESNEQISFENEFSMLVITKEYYDDIDEVFIEYVFDLLENYHNKLFVALLDFPDLNFLQYTIFENEKQNYPVNSFVTTFDNFENEIKQSGAGVFIGKDNADYDEQIVNAFATKILDYNQSQ